MKFLHAFLYTLLLLVEGMFAPIAQRWYMAAAEIETIPMGLYMLLFFIGLIQFAMFILLWRKAAMNADRLLAGFVAYDENGKYTDK